jgi:integration host factor subunit beta
MKYAGACAFIKIPIAFRVIPFYIEPIRIFPLISQPGATTMNKSDLIDALSTKENLTEKNAFEIVNLIFDGFTDTLKNGERIEIRGFGSFTVREYDGYTGRNPKTGKNVDVKPKKLPFFKVGKKLKKRVNQGL